MESFNSKFTKYSKQWMPIVWAASIITRARKEGRIRDDFAVKTLIDELNKFRAQTGLLIQYDTISIPLVYTQVVTLAVYSYFVTAVFGRQWIEGKTLKDGYVNMIDLYFPIFTTLQFFFYMGWLKVAESLINPFGEDDDDFEVNWLIDRDLQVSYMIVDEMHHEHPELIKDQYWDQIFPAQLPYTIETEAFREHHPQPSTANIELPKHSLTSGLASNAKMDDMVGKSILSINNYKFPEHDAEVRNQFLIYNVFAATLLHFGFSLACVLCNTNNICTCSYQLILIRITIKHIHMYPCLVEWSILLSIEELIIFKSSGADEWAIDCKEDHFGGQGYLYFILTN